MISAIFALSDDMLSPYVTFSEAKASQGKYVQIIGKLDKNSKIVQAEKGYTFVMKEDSGDSIKVDHQDVRPLNFEHAEQVVILGRYQKEGDTFHAEKVLVKCPSKYKKSEK